MLLTRFSLVSDPKYQAHQSARVVCVNLLHICQNRRRTVAVLSVFSVAVMYSTWPRFVFRSRCAAVCLRVCGPRSTKMSSYRVAEALLTRHVGYALSCVVCLCDLHGIALHRRSLVNSRHTGQYVILGCTPRLRKMQNVHLSVANGESKPLMLGSLSFGNFALWKFPAVSCECLC